MLTKQRMTIAVALVLIVSVLIAGCSAGSSEPDADSSGSVQNNASDQLPTQQTPAHEEGAVSGEPIEIIVAAAASLTVPLTEIAENYKDTAADVNVTLDFASSGKLMTQIENGAPADIFFSASTKQMDTLESQSLIAEGTRVDLLRNEIVLIVPAGSALELQSFNDAATELVSSIAIGDVGSVPAGQYAEQTFKYLNIWDTVSSKAVFGSDVKQILSWVENAEVDCGVVYKTDATTSSNVKIAAQADEGSHNDVIYPVAIVRASEQQEAAAAFIEYLKTDESMAIFDASGFLAK